MLAEEFKKQFTCLGESAEKHITFTIPLEKEVMWIDENGKGNLSYILQFIDRARFMARSLSNFVNNPSVGIHRIKCKYGHACGIKYKYSDCFLEYTNFKDDLIEYKCLCCHKNYQIKFDESLKERFFNT